MIDRKEITPNFCGNLAIPPPSEKKTARIKKDRFCSHHKTLSVTFRHNPQGSNIPKLRSYHDTNPTKGTSLQGDSSSNLPYICINFDSKTPSLTGSISIDATTNVCHVQPTEFSPLGSLKGTSSNKALAAAMAAASKGFVFLGAYKNWDAR